MIRGLLWSLARPRAAPMPGSWLTPSGMLRRHRHAGRVSHPSEDPPQGQGCSGRVRRDARNSRLDFREAPRRQSGHGRGRRYGLLARGWPERHRAAAQRPLAHHGSVTCQFASLLAASVQKNTLSAAAALRGCIDVRAALPPQLVVLGAWRVP